MYYHRPTVIANRSVHVTLQMASSLSSKFTEWVKAVERLRDVLERGYDDTTGRRHLPECCSVRLLEKDVRFKQKVRAVYKSYSV